MDAKTYQLENSPVVVACSRTAIGRAHAERGVFRKVRGDELLASVIKAVVQKSNVDSNSIEDVIIGATQQHGEQGGNIARCVSLMVGLPFGAAAASVNRLCGSSLQALSQAAHAIAAGAENVQIVGGVDHMHHLPMDSAVSIHPQVFTRSSKGMVSMGMTAEYLANVHGISREKQELFAIESHRKASQATSEGRFSDEIIPVLGHEPSGGICWVDTDQSIRFDSSLEAMADLKPAFLPRVGTITAATSAPLSDGAAAMLVMSKAEADRQQLTPMGRVLGTAVVGVSPALMGTGPVHAVEKVLKRTGLRIDEIDYFEINEAFAAQAIYCLEKLGINPEKVNVHGGSLSIGHPLGASGARIATTLLHVMREHGGKYGIATMCIGLGQGIAIVFERLE